MYPRRWTLIGLTTVVTTLAVAVSLPRLMPGFLPYLMAILSPLVVGITVWTTRSLPVVLPPEGLGEARAVLDGCTIPILIVDLKGKICFGNLACRELGLPVGENPGIGMVSMLHAVDGPVFLQSLMGLAESADMMDVVDIRIEAAGSAIPLVARLNRLGSSDYAVMCLLEPLEMPESVLDTSAIFQAKLDVICHGSQGPLVGISSVCAALLKTEVEEEQQEWFTHLHISANQLVRVFHDLRFLVDLEAGRSQMTPASVRLTDLLDGLIAEALHEHTWPAPLITVIDKGVPDYVFADPVLLRKVLSSMLLHSMKEAPFSELAVHVALGEYNTGDVPLIFSTYPTGENPASVSRSPSSWVAGRSMDIARHYSRWLDGTIEHRVEGGGLGVYRLKMSVIRAPAPAMTPEAAKLRGVQAVLVDRVGKRRLGLLARLDRLGLDLQVVPDGPLAVAAVRRVANTENPVELVVLYEDVDDTGGDALIGDLQAGDFTTPMVLRIAPYGWRESELSRDVGEKSDGEARLLEPVNQQDLVYALDELLRRRPIWSRMPQVGDE